ncbi:MAG: SoxR reducing system RseC family protein [Deltaproteobacteria bacterium]|nr:SoxR reducing system RseC family protein [Deltaproteobacteria bacterium]
MEENGVVISVKKDTVLIKASRSSACDSCAQKRSCSTGGGGEDMLIEADNAIGAEKGDRVVFAVGAGSVMKAGVLLYLVPILSFIAGVVIGQAVAAPLIPTVNADLVSGALGVFFIAGAFIGLKLYNRTLEKRGGALRPRLLRKV